MKKTLKRLFAFLIVAAACVIGWAALDSGGDAPMYRTTEVTRGNITEIVTATGTLNPMQLVNVGTQVSGQVNKIYVEVNDEVKEGQLLAEIDPSLLATELRQSQSSMETAKVAYEQAGRDLDRTRQLVAKDYLPKVDLEKAQQAYLAAKNSYDAAKSQVERNEVNLNYAKIYSPINGIVILQEVTLGQTVAATYQTPNLFKIAGDLTQMKIDVAFSEADISKIKPDMNVKFTVDAYPDREFEGTVQLVNLNATNTSGVVTYSVTVSVNNKDKALLPGMTASVSVTLSEVKDVLRVPAAAMRFTPPPEQVSGLQRLFQPGMRSRPARSMVNFFSFEGEKPTKATLYLLKDGKPEPVEVMLGQSDDVNIAVSGEGIAEGDQVITGVVPAKR